MKYLNFSSMIALLLFVFVSCTATREQEVEGEVNEFRSWVNMQTSRLSERTEEDWKQTKEEFRQRTAELDQKQDKLSDRLKADYQQIKEDFQERERERDQMAERRTQSMEWERELLGTYADAASVNAGNIRQAYITFLENVRSKRSNWDNEDWEMAKLVLEELNKRKDAVEGDISTEDEVKIKALQMEFTALETGDDLGGN